MNRGRIMLGLAVTLAITNLAAYVGYRIGIWLGRPYGEAESAPGGAVLDGPMHLH